MTTEKPEDTFDLEDEVTIDGTPVGTLGDLLKHSRRMPTKEETTKWLEDFKRTLG